MANELILSLFPGVGLLDAAFEEEGFCVVRGPDLLWGGDVRTFHVPAGAFAGVIGGPPCQPFTLLSFVVKANGNTPRDGNLIPEFERVVAEARPRWFLMEQVLTAPLPAVEGYVSNDVVVTDAFVGGNTSRRRRFTFGTPEGLELDVPADSVRPPGRVIYDAVTTDTRAGGVRTKPGGGVMPHTGPRVPLTEMLRRQGFPETLLNGVPLTMEGKRRVVGNGVPRAMGRAVAKAVRAALESGAVEAAA